MPQLLLCSILAALYFNALILPAGFLLRKKVFVDCPPQFQFAASFALGCLAYVAALALLRLTGATPSLIAWTLRAVAFLCLFTAMREHLCASFISREQRPIFVIWHLAYFTALVTAAYPSARINDVQPQTLQQISQLAIDNLIPYNTARYFVENIPFDAISVVPGWSFTERGPLAGMLTAAMMLVLGVSDNGHWLSAKPGIFFAAEAFLVWLNSFSLYVVWLLGRRFFGARAAVCALMLLTSSYFFWVNSYYAWPKLFAASLFLLGALLFLERRAVLGGIFLAESFLAHESVVFSLLAFLPCAIFYSRRQLRPLAITGATFGAIYLPWAIFRVFSGASSGRLLANHLLCAHDDVPLRGGFVSSLRDYLTHTSWSDILRVRLENIAYPFNPLHAGAAYTEHWRTPYTLVFSLSHLTFYELMYAVGIPACLLALPGFIRRSEFRPIALGGLGSLLVAGLLIACPLMTVNHAWAYPLFLLMAIASGAAVQKPGFFACLLFGAAFANNLLFLIVSFYYGEARFVAVNAAPLYIGLQIAAWLLLLFALVWSLIKADDESLTLSPS